MALSVTAGVSHLVLLSYGDGVLTPVAAVVHLGLPVTLTKAPVKLEARTAVDLPNISAVAIVVAPAGSIQVWEGPVLGTDELLLCGQLQDDGGGGQPRHCSHHPQGDVVEHGLDRGAH